MTYRNRKLLDSVRDTPCVRCGSNDGSTVAAHYTGWRRLALGGGFGIKVDDRFHAALCAACHREMDSGGRSKSRAVEHSEEFLFLIALTTMRSDSAPAAEPKLWLWRNGDHFLAFEHLYPCFTPGGDPMTLGEPVGYAVVKRSFDRAAGSAGATLLTNPHTGTPRDWRDVESDPEGKLIVKAGEPLRAADDSAELRARLWEKEVALRQSEARLAEAERKSLIAAHALVRAFNELNAIRARDGVPRDYTGMRVGVDEEYFSSVVDDVDAAVLALTGRGAHCHPLLYERATDSASEVQRG